MLYLLKHKSTEILRGACALMLHNTTIRVASHYTNAD